VASPADAPTPSASSSPISSTPSSRSSPNPSAASSAPATAPSSSPPPKKIRDNRTPYLLFDRNFPHLAANFVGTDDVKVGELATNHLIDIGRKRIAHIGGRNSSPSYDRLRGYRNALAAAHLPVDESLIVSRERVEESGDIVGFQVMQELLALPKRPDAVFCYNDLTAVGAIDATLKAGLRVPEDIAFIGCGNLRYAPYLRVPLSSIDHGTTELGRVAGQFALELSAKPQQEPRSMLVPSTLVARESTIGLAKK
jgi:LacI family transcriptional regulator